jgi:hypothetical protein
VKKPAVRWIVAGMCIALAVAVVLDLERRQKLARLVGADMHAASEQLSARVVSDVRRCGPAASRADIGNLSDAFIAVESLGAGWLERTVEAWLVRAGRLTGLAPPDISIGPGQVRISTAVAAAQWAAVHHRDLLRLSKQEVMERLLSVCGSRRLVVRVLEMLIDKGGLGDGSLDRQLIARLARLYNGQETIDGNESAIANHLYRELVYHVYQSLRFRRAAIASPA